MGGHFQCFRPLSGSENGLGFSLWICIAMWSVAVAAAAAAAASNRTEVIMSHIIDSRELPLKIYVYSFPSHYDIRTIK